MTRQISTTASLLLALAVGTTCGRNNPPAPESGEELPTLDVTAWSDKTELFMEYPPLVAGQPALYAVHLTRLSDFSAMTTGRPSIEFTPDTGGKPVVLQGNAPSRPGVYRVEGPSPAAGVYRFALVVDAPDLQDRHELGRITVYPDEDAATAAAKRDANEDAAAISYLKEPQWTNGFATAVVRDGDIRQSIRVPAVIGPLTGGDAVVSAPADGRFSASALLSIGTHVQPGQELGRIEPRASDSSQDRAALSAAVAEAEAGADAAHAELTRAEHLLAERAVPARRVEEARRAVTVADARLTAARARLVQRDETLRSGGGGATGNSFVLRAPIAGRIAEVAAALGASYSEGAPLFRIVRTDRVELQVHVPVADVARTAAVSAIALEVPGRSDLLTLDADHRHDAGVIDNQTKALPVQFDVDNRAGHLLIGQTATAVLYTGGRDRMPVVPKDAVLTEGGRPFVFVQNGGESFSRRFIEVAARDRDLVGVRNGVRAGERVVTRGAYDVQLASAAGGLPAEGHVH